MAWLGAAAAGFAVILGYQTGSGASGVSPALWPAGSQLTLDPKLYTLVMFAHPQCPCTRATIDELNSCLARVHGQAAAQVWFYKPPTFSQSWLKSGLWKSAEAIPGVTVHEDINGTQAKTFGAETSGCVLLYDTQGHLLFKGGITGSRGHAGNNAGEEAIVSLCEGNGLKTPQAIAQVTTPVYGCSLLGECEDPAQRISK